MNTHLSEFRRDAVRSKIREVPVADVWRGQSLKPLYKPSRLRDGTYEQSVNDSNLWNGRYWSVACFVFGSTAACS